MHRNRLAAALLGTTALLAVATAAVAQQQTTPAQPGIDSPATSSGMTASGLRDKPVYDAAGQEIGQVASVVVGSDDQPYAVVRGGLFGTRQVLVPVGRLGYQDDRFVANGFDDEQLRALPDYTAGAGGYRDADDTVALNVMGYTPTAGTQTAQAGGEAATNIVVQQAAPAIRVDQVPPQITVQQAQPQVTVRQAQPEILVRQPAPTVTVDIPQPEIIVRMPAPEVAVAQAQPQVQVQAAQPQVNVQQAAGAQAAVQMDGGNQQPVVRYERAEPRVVVNQQQGEPQVRVEGMQGGGAAAVEPAAGAAPMAPVETAAVPGAAVPPSPTPPAPPAQDTAAPPLAPPATGADTTVAAAPPATEATTGAAAGGGVPLAQLLDMNVVDANGRNLGEIDRVVQGQYGRPQAVVGIGSFLGIGERAVALPLENLALYNDRQVVIRDLDDAALRALPAFGDRDARDVARDFTAQVEPFQR